LVALKLSFFYFSCLHHGKTYMCLKQTLCIQQGSVGTSEVTQVDVGDFRATLEHNSDGQEIIRISRPDPSPAASMGGAQNIKVTEEEHWRQVLTALTDDEKKGDVVLPASVLHLYQQFLNKQVPGSTGGSSAQLRAAWLLAELVQLGVASRTSDRSAAEADKRQVELDTKGAEKQVPVNSAKSQSNDDIVVGMVEEEDCDSGNEITETRRTSSDSEHEVKKLVHGSDEL
jgi:hypothetical protein